MATKKIAVKKPAVKKTVAAKPKTTKKPKAPKPVTKPKTTKKPKKTAVAPPKKAAAPKKARRSKLKPVRISFVLDRSGSMSSMWTEAINGLNTFITDQQKLGGEGTFSLYFFDNEYTKHQTNTKLADVKPIGPADVIPRGTTALYDAIGRTIDLLLDKPAAKNELTIMAIMTDGGENASQDYTLAKVQDLIAKAHALKYEIVFLGANLDVKAFTTSTGMNAGNTVAYAATPAAARGVINTLSASVSNYRKGATSFVDMTVTTPPDKDYDPLAGAAAGFTPPVTNKKTGTDGK